MSAPLFFLLLVLLMFGMAGLTWLLLWLDDRRQRAAWLRRNR